ncbi:hypothetical protein QBC39DRAFT_35530 [Podospora conica]|nr:hypothetical protein QBC39DRAFT_35530 [Schizothecium conicum]
MSCNRYAPRVEREDNKVGPAPPGSVMLCDRYLLSAAPEPGQLTLSMAEATQFPLTGPTSVTRQSRSATRTLNINIIPSGGVARKPWLAFVRRPDANAENGPRPSGCYTWPTPCSCSRPSRMGLRRFSFLWLARVAGMSWTPALLPTCLSRLASCRSSITAYHADDSWHCRASVPMPACIAQDSSTGWMTSSPRAISSHRELPTSTPPILASRNTRSMIPSATTTICHSGWLVPTADPALGRGVSSIGTRSTSLLLRKRRRTPFLFRRPLFVPCLKCRIVHLPPLCSSPRLEPPIRADCRDGTQSDAPLPPSHTCVDLDRDGSDLAPRRALNLVQRRTPEAFDMVCFCADDGVEISPKRQGRASLLVAAGALLQTAQSPSENKAARPARQLQTASEPRMA